MGIVDCHICTHPLINEVFLNIFREKIFPIVLIKFYGKCHYKFTGKATIFCLFVFFHHIPKNTAVTPFWRGDWWKEYFFPDKATLSGVVMLYPVVIIIDLGTAQISGSCHSGATGSTADNLRFQMVNCHCASPSFRFCFCCFFEKANGDWRQYPSLQ